MTLFALPESRLRGCAVAAVASAESFSRPMARSRSRCRRVPTS